MNAAQPPRGLFPGETSAEQPVEHTLPHDVLMLGGLRITVIAVWINGQAVTLTTQNHGEMPRQAGEIVRRVLPK